MARKTEEHTLEKRSTEIAAQKGDSSLDIDGVQITGSPASKAVIGGRGMQAVNVAQDATAGHVFLVSGSQRPSPDIIRKAIEELHLAAGQRDHLLSTFEDILAELDKGDQADIALVNYLLKLVDEYSPAIARMLTDWMVNLPGAPKSLAR